MKSTSPRLHSLYYAETDEERTPEHFPSMFTISAAFIYGLLPVPKEKRTPEYVEVPVRDMADVGYVATWNTAWEAGHLRSIRNGRDLPASYEWLRRFEGHNLCLLPAGDARVYHRFAPLYHLLPLRVLERFGLPVLRRGAWPFTADIMRGVDFPADLERRLERAWSDHIWPYLTGEQSSTKRRYSRDEPLQLLSHGLEFWLPHVHSTIENFITNNFERTTPDTDKARARYARIRDKFAAFDGIEITSPRMGGDLWRGEADAHEATTAIVDAADADGRLRSLIDDVRSNRQREDFSDRWSREREDFERSFHHKRAKAKIVFVEMPGTIPVQGPHAEIDFVPAAGDSDTASEAVTNVVWENLLSAVDVKSRRIVIALRSGETRVGEISTILGYANHSPVSKRLRRIRHVAMHLLRS